MDPRPMGRGPIPMSRSVFLGKQDRRLRPVRLRQNPQPLAHLGPVGAQQAIAVQKGHFILHAVLFRYLAPVAGHVPVEELLRMLAGLLQLGKRSRRRHHPSQLEEHHLRAYQVSTKKLTSQWFSSSSWKSLLASSVPRIFSIFSLIRSFFAVASGLSRLMDTLPVNVKSSKGFQTPSVWNTSWTSFENADSAPHWSHMIGTATLATVHSFSRTGMTALSSRKPRSEDSRSLLACSRTRTASSTCASPWAALSYVSRSSATMNPASVSPARNLQTRSRTGSKYRAMKSSG